MIFNIVMPTQEYYGQQKSIAPSGYKGSTSTRPPSSELRINPDTGTYETAVPKASTGYKGSTSTRPPSKDLKINPDTGTYETAREPAMTGRADISPSITKDNFSIATSSQKTSQAIPESQRVTPIYNEFGYVVGLEDKGAQKTYLIKPTTTEQVNEYEQNRYKVALLKEQARQAVSSGKKVAKPYDYSVTSPIDRFKPVTEYDTTNVAPETKTNIFNTPYTYTQGYRATGGKYPVTPQKRIDTSTDDFYGRIQQQTDREKDVMSGIYTPYTYGKVRKGETYASDKSVESPFKLNTAEEEGLTRGNILNLGSYFTGAAKTGGQQIMEFLPSTYLATRKAAIVGEGILRSLTDKDLRQNMQTEHERAQSQVVSTLKEQYNPLTGRGALNLGIAAFQVKAVGGFLRAKLIKPSSVKTDFTNIDSKRVVTERAVSDRMKYQITTYTKGQAPKTYTGTAGQLYEQVKSNPKLYKQFGGAISKSNFKIALRGLSEVGETSASTLTRVTGTNQPTKFLVTKTEDLLPKFDTKLPSSQQQLSAQRISGKTDYGTIKKGGTLRDFQVKQQGVSLTKELAGFEEGGKTTQYLRTKAVSIPSDTGKDVSNVLGGGLPKFNVETPAPPSSGGGLHIFIERPQTAVKIGGTSKIITIGEVKTIQATKLLPNAATTMSHPLQQAAAQTYISGIKSASMGKVAVASTLSRPTFRQSEPSLILKTTSNIVSISKSSQKTQPQVILSVPKSVKPTQSIITGQSIMPLQVNTILPISGGDKSTKPLQTTIMLPITLPDRSILPITKPVPVNKPTPPPPPIPPSPIPPFIIGGLLPPLSIYKPIKRNTLGRGSKLKKKYQPSLFGLVIKKKSSKAFKGSTMTGFEIRGL